MRQKLAVLLWKEDSTLHDQSTVMSEDILQLGPVAEMGTKDLWCRIVLLSPNFHHLVYGSE